MTSHNDEAVKNQLAGMLEYMHRAQSRKTPKKADSYRTKLQEIDARRLELEISKRDKEVYE
jgi:hypothetical protein